MFSKVNVRSEIPVVLFVIAAAAMATGIFMIAQHPTTNDTGTASHASASQGEGKQAPEFNISAIGGGKINLKDYRGKVVVLDFWSIACGPCIDANQNLQRLYEDYQKLGLQVVGLSLDRDSGAVEEFLKTNPVNYPIGLATDDIIKNYGGIFAIPQTFVLDRNGRIVRKYEGFSELTSYQIEKMVKKLLSAG